MSALLLLASLALLVLNLAPRLPSRPNILIDLPTHFVVQYSAGAIVLFMLSLCFGAWLAALISILCFCVSFLELKSLLPTKRQLAPEGPTLKLLQSNVLKSNTQPEKLRMLIEKEQPDIVTSCEVNPEFAAMLAGLKDAWPHQFITEGTDSYRVAVISKLPFLKIEQTAFGGARTDALVFRVDLGGKPIDGVSIHPYTPTANINSRDGEFAAIAKRFAGEKPERLFIAGDFNATPWCPAMKQLTKSLSLRNAREGRGINTSWPSMLPFLFRIPIDHVLVSPNLGVASFATGPTIGSDHLPTLTVLYAK